MRSQVIARGLHSTQEHVAIVVAVTVSGDVLVAIQMM